MATRTISNSGGNYNSTGSWVEGVVPTSSDDIVATGTSGNLTITATAVCRSANFTNYVGTFTHNAFNWSIGNVTGGDLLFVSGMTYTVAVSTSCKITFVSTLSTANITTAGKTIRNFTINSAGGICTYTLQDNLVVTSAIVVTNGILSAVSYNVTSSTVSTGGGTINMGSGTWSITSWTGNGSAALNQETSTLILSGVSTVVCAGTAVFYNVIVNSSTLLLFDVFSYTNSLIIHHPCTITFAFASGGELDLLSSSSVSIVGTSSSVIEFKSDSGGNQTPIVGDGSSTYNFKHLKLIDSITNNGTFNAINSIDNGDNTGWNFLTQPEMDAIMFASD